MSKIFCERVREIIQIRGRTNQELADATGIDRKMIIKLKNDPTYDPKLSVAVKLADDLGVPLSWLLGWDNEAKVVEVTKTETVREVIEVPVVEVREIRRKFFNPKWEEDE